MVRSQAWAFRALAFSVTAMLVVACGGSNPTTAPGATTAPGGATTPPATTAAGPAKGGTIYVLTQAEQWDQVDPQRVYTGEDLAFFGGLTMRSLISYVYSADPKQGTSITPDMATDLGTATDGGKTWSFTLRDGVTWQDGTDVTCADVKYGVSRTFATDVINQGPTYAVAYLDIPTDAEGQLACTRARTRRTGQDLYDKAVTCDGKTITFHLNKPVADFNYTVTLGFSPVRQADDTGETYGTVAPWVDCDWPVQGRQLHDRQRRQDGPRPKSELEAGQRPDPQGLPGQVGSRLRNRSEGHRPAAHGSFGRRRDRDRVRRQSSPRTWPRSSQTRKTANPDYTGRAFSDYDPYARYYWVNVNKVKNVKIRQAMAVALDRDGNPPEHRWRVRRRLRRRVRQAEHRRGLRSDRVLRLLLREVHSGHG